MAKHMVICEQCGRRFDANTGSYYNSASRRYTCKSCATKIQNQQRAIQRQENAARRKAAADEREKRTGMRQSKGAMIAKLVFGVLFFISGIRQGNATGIIIGMALLAWGLVPYLKSRKLINPLSNVSDAVGRIKQAAQRGSKPDGSPTMNINRGSSNDEKWTCRWCGAVTSGDVCEYCNRKKE